MISELIMRTVRKKNTVLFSFNFAAGPCVVPAPADAFQYNNQGGREAGTPDGFRPAAMGGREMSVETHSGLSSQVGVAGRWPRMQLSGPGPCIRGGEFNTSPVRVTTRKEYRQGSEYRPRPRRWEIAYSK